MSLGWMTEGTQIPKKRKELDIAQDDGIKALTAMIDKAQSEKKAGTYQRPSKPLSAEDKLMSVTNSGVEERNKKDAEASQAAKNLRQSKMEEKVAKYELMQASGGIMPNDSKRGLGSSDDTPLVDFAKKNEVNEQASSYEMPSMPGLEESAPQAPPSKNEEILTE